MKGLFNRPDKLFQHIFSLPMTAVYLQVVNEVVNTSKNRNKYLFKTFIFAFILWADALSENAFERGSRVLDQEV
jgi:hypothetical protein